MALTRNGRPRTEDIAVAMMFGDAVQLDAEQRSFAHAESDRYSCYSLYGAYGPYGGAGYSGCRFGWGYRW